MKPGDGIAVAVNRNNHQKIAYNRANQFKGFGKIQEFKFISDGNSTYVDIATLREVLKNMNGKGDSDTGHFPIEFRLKKLMQDHLQANQFKTFGKVQEFKFISDGNSTFVDIATLREMLKNVNGKGDSDTGLAELHKPAAADEAGAIKWVMWLPSWVWSF